MKRLLVLLCTLSTVVGLHAQSNANMPEAERRENPDKLLIYWDTSMNPGDRKITSEIELLKAYIEAMDDVKVVVSKFDDTVYETQTFNCAGNCESLYAYLTNSNYNGASNYSDILQKNEHKVNISMVFTDGVTLFEPLDSEIDVPVFIVNSSKSAPHRYLSELAAATQGGYVDLSNHSGSESLKILNYYQVNSEENKITAEAQSLYYGVVYNEVKAPIQGAVVRVKNTFKEVQTETNGRYKIDANAGDILEISALGMVTKDTLLTQNRKTHIPMVADGELLGEVLVQQKKKEDEKVDDVFGNQKRDAAGYSLGQKFTSKDIQPYHTTLAQILVRMPGVVIEGVDGVNEKFVFRKTANASFLNGGKTYPAVILDGLPIDQSTQRVPFINPLTIKSITLLKSALSTVRYGQIAAYGAIVIELKDYDDGDVPVAQNTALVRGNDYAESVPLFAQAAADLPKPNYLKVLEQSASFEEAKSLYFKQLKYERNNLEYYLTVAPYFERWNADFSMDVLSNIAVVAGGNVKALKILAYKYEEKGAFEKARYVYEQLVNLQPQDLQSYRDLALVYVQTGEYELAATLYRQMLFNTIPNVDFTPIEDIVINEFRNLIMNHKSKINYKGLPSAMLAVDFEIDIRFMLEWNHPGAEFDVQIVSPEKKYFSYSHTAFNNQELLKSEIEAGFFLKEFVIDEGEKGPWIVNIRHSGQHNDNVPLVFKYTQYKNYGTPQETKSVKVIQLDKFQDKLTLDSFEN